jgi:hypothetical protein
MTERTKVQGGGREGGLRRGHEEEGGTVGFTMTERTKVQRSTGGGRSETGGRREEAEGSRKGAGGTQGSVYKTQQF